MADSEDEDNEEEERSQAKEQRRLTRQRSRVWLKDGGGDEPLNFLDPRVVQRVLGEQEATGPGAQKTDLPWCEVPRWGGLPWEPAGTPHPHIGTSQCSRCLLGHSLGLVVMKGVSG